MMTLPVSRRNDDGIHANQYYGTSFKPGQRVALESDGRQGVVMRRQGDDQYIKVRFDDGTTGPCHPIPTQSSK